MWRWCQWFLWSDNSCLRLSVCNRNLHQQHLGHDVQERKLWNWRDDIPSLNQGKTNGRDCIRLNQTWIITISKAKCTRQFLMLKADCCLLESSDNSFSFFYVCVSTTLSSEMLSGTAANTTWSVTCCGWWRAGPSSSMCGTSLPWPYRYAWYLLITVEVAYWPERL